MKIYSQVEGLVDSNPEEELRHRPMPQRSGYVHAKLSSERMERYAVRTLGGY